LRQALRQATRQQETPRSITTRNVFGEKGA
jgi:hypothetical protein